MAHRPIVRSIWLTVIALFVVQAIIAAAVMITYQVPVSGSVWYLIVTPLFHLIVGIVLASLHKLFVKVETNEMLSRVNIPNLLSLIRVSSAPTLLWLVLLARTYSLVWVLVPLTAVVFLTDLLDGQISRRTHQITRIGAYLDSSSDYTVLFIVAIALVSYGLISDWLFVIVMLRVGLQLVGQIVLFVVQHMHIHFRTSFLGKASVFVLMTFFAFSLLRLIDDVPTWFATLYTVAQYFTAALAVVSLVEKVFLFAADAQTAGRQARERRETP